jgi:Zn-dependent protease
MAQERGIPVASITLFIFGGVARITDEPDRPLTEFLIALMGPLMSVALASLFGAVWLWLRIIDGDGRAATLPFVPLVLFFGILAQANGALALFNLAPGFPLDGGRILRAVLWGLSHNFRRATRWATRAGQGIAILLLLAGAWLTLTEFSASGIWYILIAVFLWNAAREGYRQAVTRDTLSQVRVDQIMTRHVERVPPELTLERFVHDYLLPSREEIFAVSSNDTLLGAIETSTVLRVPHSEWPTRCVEQHMIPLARLQPLAPDQTASAAWTRLTRSATEELPVVNLNNELIGFLGRNQLARYLKLRL